MMLVAGAMACGLAACSDDDTTPSGNITPADQLYLPRNNATIMLETGNTTHFEWAVSKASKNGYITYELLFDKVDGDFSQPLYVLTSDNNGYEPSAKVASSTLNTVATLAGADLGETATVKWTVRAWCGLNSEIYGSEAGVRTVSLTRINSVDPMPSEIKISGGITEGQKELTLFAASVIHTAKGKYTDQREAGAYEIFTKLTAGELIITDDLNRNFRLAEKNRMELIKDNEATTAVTVEHDGIYWLYVNFSNMTYKFKEISKVASSSFPVRATRPNSRTKATAYGALWTTHGTSKRAATQTLATSSSVPMPTARPSSGDISKTTAVTRRSLRLKRIRCSTTFSAIHSATSGITLGK